LHRLLATSTPLGRRLRPKLLGRGEPRLRVKTKDLEGAGVDWVERSVGVVDGYPQFQDGSVLDVANVVWCTGFDPGFSWIDLPVSMTMAWSSTSAVWWQPSPDFTSWVSNFSMHRRHRHCSE
jgi:hypothetical protein